MHLCKQQASIANPGACLLYCMETVMGETPIPITVLVGLHRLQPVPWGLCCLHAAQEGLGLGWVEVDAREEDGDCI